MFIYHLELNDFFGEGSKILKNAVMQLPAAGTGVNPAAPALGVQDFILSQGASVWA